MSPEHTPLGDKYVPMLSQEHALVNHARHRPLHIPQPGEPGYDDYISKRYVALEIGVKALERLFLLYTGDLGACDHKEWLADCAVS
ncbi:uncharacterized protein BDZ99DRAFT_464574 [Mytilinidion resinicola]|uniref:Uncharacterized protein n=1 Tax=Mytilinidion resinicola TaxID=574789 RepID=A0A6A6YFQ8_9PEZI|nr:uncharacterized protein BDZ99DRAFT_464574 [Mytilinidion resinicola]KAF2807656.1 hypothetical protein BDZ99DRAFT_464574 [Mytilinidion resinicola]